MRDDVAGEMVRVAAIRLTLLRRRMEEAEDAYATAVGEACRTFGLQSHELVGLVESGTVEVALLALVGAVES